jgi:hypothetical protein
MRFVPAALLLIACGSSAPKDLAHSPVTIGPIPLRPSQETTQCIVVKLPSDVDVDVVEIDATLAPGSHHLIIYKSQALDESLKPSGCTSFSGVLGGDQPLFIAQSPTSTLKLPTGVAWHLPANQMLLLEAHYLNASANMIQGMGSVTFIPGDPNQTYQPADLMFCGSVSQLGGGAGFSGNCPSGVGLPPGQVTSLSPDFYGGTVNTTDPTKAVDLTKLKVFGLTGHQHRHGTDFKIWKTTDGTDPSGLTPIYESVHWDNAPLEDFDDAHLISFAPNEGLMWQCTYDTSMESQSVCFGESAATQEMCFLWAYYYPSVGRFVQGRDCWR